MAAARSGAGFAADHQLRRPQRRAGRQLFSLVVHRNHHYVRQSRVARGGDFFDTQLVVAIPAPACR